jgi:hypothetical protein
MVGDEGKLNNRTYTLIWTTQTMEMNTIAEDFVVIEEMEKPIALCMVSFEYFVMFGER